MSLPRFEARLVHNPSASRMRAYGARERAVLSLDAHRAARAEIGSWPGYAPTPLVSLPDLARALDIGQLLYKDEGHRFGLRSFKALGGAYAVLSALRAAGGGHGGAGPRRLTVAAATDGNHGRSVAWGAQMFGCRCVIYLHQHVSATREAEIARFGAEIVRVAGHYDDSVRRCAADAEANGWALVADTSDDPAAAIPALVMQGYTLIAQEVLDALPDDQRPTHLFVQAGVGGLAAALGAHFWEVLGPARPRLIVVEPKRADCVFRTVEAGRPVPIEGDTDTFMACLAAGEVSAPAWVVLEHAADDVIALDDQAAMDTMRLLARGFGQDPALVSGESGCAATAGVIAAATDPRIRAALALDGDSRVLAIGSEGATDEDTFHRVVGQSAEAVGSSAAETRKGGGR